MIDTFVRALYPWMSQERLEAYRPQSGTDREMLVNYFYNSAISESLYTSLGFLEVTLRNSLHTTLTDYYGISTWYERPGVLAPNQMDDVIKAKRRISGLGKSITAGRVVAELTFGFWVSLLSSHYDRRFWWPQNAQLLKTAFPQIPTNLRQRGTIYYRYNRLRELRNRVFHYEPIWNRPTLSQDHNDIYEAIGWISQNMATAALLADRFPVIATNGKAHIEVMLETHLGIS